MGEIYERFFRGDEALPKFVFMHGDFQNHTIFRNIENKLNEKNYSTLSFDLPGHGNSIDFRISLNNFLKDYLERKKIIKPIIIGNSFGGVLALDYALKTRNASGIILINCPISSIAKLNSEISMENIFNQYKSFMENSKQKLIDFNEIKNLSEEEIVKIAMENSSINAFLNNAEVYRNFNPDKEIQKLQIPILWIVSENDRIISKDYAEEQIKNLKKGKLIFISGNHNILFNNSEIKNNIFNYIDLLKTL
ncbi:MAG: alpha/beta hydrolase [Candidatus Pacearchaeota archaeon]|jgi:pimeloyl-ACP methyl ester carboxylesterase